jgi:bacterioferritin-associated ferredoxin
MIVCHCNTLTDRDIRAAVDELLAEMPVEMITPIAVYEALGKSSRCGGCFPLTARLIRDHLAARGIKRSAA